MVDASMAARRGGAPPRTQFVEELEPTGQTVGGRALYLDLAKRALCNILYADAPLNLQGRGTKAAFDLERRIGGEDLPSEAHTFTGLRRLDNLQDCIEQALRDGVPGDLLEAGVGRGGASIFMRAVLKAHGVTDRRVYACDRFPDGGGERLAWPAALLVRTSAWIPSRRWRRHLFHAIQASGRSKDATNQRSFPDVAEPSDQLVDMAIAFARDPGLLARLATPLAVVKRNFAAYDLLDEQTVFVPGFFADTLPVLDAPALAVLRLDADTEESTATALAELYDRLSPGGFCIIDDYHSFPDCRRAVDRFRADRGIVEAIQPIDSHAVFWRRA